jgi:TldD protein
MEDLTQLAVAAAQAAGAAYADARFVRQREETVEVKNGTVAALSQERGQGVGIRVLVDGAWGFAATTLTDAASLRETAQMAVRIARASATAKQHEVELADVEPARARIKHTAQRDPFAVPLEERIALLLDCDRLMSAQERVRVRSGSIRLVQEEKHFASSEGADIYQESIESGAEIEARAVTEDGSDTQVRSYPSSHGGNMGTEGWELVERLDLAAHAEQVAAEACALLDAPHCPAGIKDIILESSQLALQIHESCGHPIELDRVLGMEASFAGGSFLTPEKLGNFRYGSEVVNINADATVPGGLGSFAYDDEGVPGQRTPIVDRGQFVGYLSSRETATQIGLKASSGTMRADGWNRIPLIRMTNINLEPGDWGLDEIIADTQDGLYLLTNTSWSIDDKRLNFQFGTQMAYEIKDGSLGRLYKNATYNSITPQFWSACDAVAGRRDWLMWGVPNCGKGEPMQTARVGHGASAARFRNVRVGVLQE